MPIYFHRPQLARLGIVLLLLSTGALLLAALGQATASTAVAGAVDATCFATPDDGATVYSSTTAQAVRDAVDAAPAGGRVKIAGYCAGVVAQGGSTQTVLITKTLTLAGGYTPMDWTQAYPVTQPTTLDAQSQGRVIYASAALTLHGFTLTHGNEAYGAGLYAASAATLTAMTIFSNQGYFGGGAYFAGAAVVSATTFTDNTGGGAYFVDTAQIVDSDFSHNQSTYYGGGAYFYEYGDDGVVTIINTTFFSNTAWRGGGIASGDRTITLTGTTFVSNTASAGGGAFLYNAHAFITNTSFTGNIDPALMDTHVGDWRGGGGLFFNGGILSLKDTTFSNNKAYDRGGGMYFAGGQLFMTTTTFSHNTSDYRGGGAYIDYALINLADTTFSGNTSAYGGGGMYLAWGVGAMTNTAFFNNRASDRGGGAYILGELSLAGTNFISNTVINGDGGGAYIDAVQVSLTATTFLSNTAQGKGGGAYFKTDFHAPLVATTTQFLYNTAYLGGGAYLNQDDQRADRLRFVNTLFAANTAITTGAALYAYRPNNVAPVELIHTTIVSPTLVSRPALYVQSGTVYLTNTLIASHTVGIAHAGGSVFEDYTLFSDVTVPYSGTVLSGGHSFTATAGFRAPTLGDYRLDFGSPAIDAGTNASIAWDFEGDPRPMGSGYDLGYDEAPAAAYRYYLPWVGK